MSDVFGADFLGSEKLSNMPDRVDEEMYEQRDRDMYNRDTKRRKDDDDSNDKNT